MKNIKFILGFILGGIVCTSIGVFATIYYEASQINYKNTTLDHAIDELYTTQNTTLSSKDAQITNLEGQITTLNNKLKSIQIPLRAGSTSKTYYGQADLGATGWTYIKNTYSYFKVSNLTKSNNGNNCKIIGYSLSLNNWVDISENTEYSLSPYSNIGLKVYSYADNSWGNCSVSIDIYNK